MSLFQSGKFTLSSGIESDYKIDCDFLTDDDIAALAKIAMTILPDFRRVLSVPTGGDRLADAMREYTDPESTCLLIVDDVFTTGRSITELRDKVHGERNISDPVNNYWGLVIFDRNEGPTRTPGWITPIFKLLP